VASITNLEHVRAAFAAGVSLESSAALHTARDTGSNWEGVTEAVAAGLAERYGLPQPMAVVPVERSPALVALASATALRVLRTATRLQSRTRQADRDVLTGSRRT
jgi:hypothetical protein